VLAVNPARIPSFILGYKSAGGKEIIEVQTFAQAEDWIIRNRKPGDVILLENDLPDLYERIPSI
jgi:UDP-N-acetylmuramoyl-tripeptide--D-alanyl-D-alanine ligase